MYPKIKKANNIVTFIQKSPVALSKGLYPATLTIHGKGFRALPLTGIKVNQTSNLTKGQGTLTVTSNATNQFSNGDFVYKADGVLVGKVSGVQSTTLTFTGGTPANTQADVVNDEQKFAFSAHDTMSSSSPHAAPDAPKTSSLSEDAGARALCEDLPGRAAA